VQRLRQRLTYANVMATIAVFIALGGASYAAMRLPKNSVGTKQIKRNAITTAKIKNGAVTGAKIKASSLGTVPSATHATSADDATIANSITPPEAPRIVGAAGQPPFASGWKGEANFGPISFYKDREGVVHLEGLAEGNNTGVAVFTLPSGYRPEKKLFFSNFGYSGATWPVYVEPNGEVQSGSKFEISLSGITFRAAG
jgi:hypothetical protein